MSTLLVALVGVSGALAAATATWLVAARQHSGRVGTTEAEVLWAEGKQMRSELREETVALRADVARMRDETAILREEAVAGRAEMAAVRSEAALLRDELAACQAEVHELRAQIAEARP